MTNFVRDNTALPVKTDKLPVGTQDPTKLIAAADWAALVAALGDLRSWVKTGLTPGSYTNAAMTVDSDGRVTVVTSGGAGVTSVSAGTGINVTGSSTVAIALANTAVTPGSYTTANITVDQQGRVTAASNGSSGTANNFGEYGDGRDGTRVMDGTTSVPGCTLSGSVYTATRETFFAGLTVNSGITFHPDSYPWSSQATVVLNGAISEKGNDGSLTTQGSATYTGNRPLPAGVAGGGSAGTAGTGSNACPDDFIVGAAAGGSSGSHNGGAGALGQGGGGGTGGASGGTPNPGGAGGTVASMAVSEGGFHSKLAATTFFSMVSRTRFGLGTGGGGGGNSSGGGGGGAGGAMVGRCPAITGTGTITVKGGAGGNGDTSGAGGGGGGGGSGGIAVMVCGTIAGTITKDVSGGAGGAGASVLAIPGGNGGAGGSGLFVQLS